MPDFSPSRHQRRCRLQIEQLEDRSLLSAVSGLGDGLFEPFTLPDDLAWALAAPVHRPDLAAAAATSQGGAASGSGGVQGPSTIATTPPSAAATPYAARGDGISQQLLGVLATGAAAVPQRSSAAGSRTQLPAAPRPTSGSSSGIVPLSAGGVWLYISNGGAGSSASAILRVSLAAGGTPATFISSGQNGLSDPQGLKFGPDTNLYVAGWGNGQILEYNSSGGNVTNAWCTSSPPLHPEDVVFGSDGNLYVDSSTTGTVYRYYGPNSGKAGQPDPSAGYAGAVFATGNGLDQCYGMAFDRAGKLYVASQATSGSGHTTGVYRFNADGSFDRLFTTASLSMPRGITFDGASPANLWVMDFGTNQGDEFDANGNWLGAKITSNANGPYGVLFSTSLYVSMATGNVAMKYDTAGNVQNPNPFASAGGLQSPFFETIH